MGSAVQPNVGLTQGWADQEDGWGDAMNANLRALDALVQARVADKDLATPPASPAAGDTYIVAASPTGAWAGQAGKIARYQAPISPDTTPVAGWEFYTPKAGWEAWVVDESATYRYSGSAWAKMPVVGNLAEISEYRANINTQTGTTYTLQATDSGKVVELGNASAIALTLPNSLPAGFNCTLVQTGAGQVALSAASGATLRNRQSQTKLAGQWAMAALYVRTNAGGAAAEYVFCGDTSA